MFFPLEDLAKDHTEIKSIVNIIFNYLNTTFLMYLNHGLYLNAILNK